MSDVSPVIWSRGRLVTALRVAVVCWVAAVFLAMPAHAATLYGRIWFQDNGTTVSIVDFEDTVAGPYVIPDYIGGKPVTAIARRAFQNASRMTGITLPAGLTSVEDEAFLRCTGLTSITLPASLGIYGYDVFKGCVSLSAVTLSPGIKRLGSGTFSGCTALKTLTIPASMTSLGEGAFAGTGISSFTVTAGNPEFSSANGVILNAAKTSVVCFPPQKAGNYVIPSTVTVVGGGAFVGCAKLTGVTIPSSVTTLSDGAFYLCTGLTAVTIPTSVTTLGNEVFAYCQALSQVKVPASVTSMGYYIFEGSGVVSVTLPPALDEIGYGMFSSCRKLRNVTIPAGVKTIHAYAFNDCRALASINIPEGVTWISNRAFADCKVLAQVTLPSTLKTLGDMAFGWCEALKTVHIPAAVTAIAEDAFGQSPAFTSFTVSPDSETYSSISGLLLNKAGDKLIACPAGKSGKLVIPSGVTTIGEFAAASCLKITSLSLPDTLVEIGNSAFSSTTGLTHVRIPIGVTRIGNSAFNNAELVEVVFVGDAPEMDTAALDYPSGDVSVKFYNNREGFTTPLWKGYATSSLGTNISDEPELDVADPKGLPLESGISSWNFGTVLLGAKGSGEITLQSKGGYDLTGLSLAIGGTNAGDFQILQGAPATLAGGEAAAIRIQFTPSGAGARSAWVEVVSDDPDESPFVVLLSGTGKATAPEIAVMQPAGTNLVDGTAKKSFGTAKIGKKGLVKTFTVKNAGTGPLTVQSVTKDGANAADFTVSSIPKTTLPAGGSLEFKVTFKPAKKGTRNAAIHIKSNDGDENPFDIKLTGMGVK